ncbi:MAG: amino acid adenylation domain-containing protein, partial [Desulfobacteraceae bacterium]|nr:amino acid adenylation domain-containing protein [Desulfobacteraceae bacterium]
VFVNTLVLRADLSGDPEFSDLVDRVRQVTLDAYGHQDIPFEQLIEVLQPPRRLSHTPLFQVMFSMQNVPLKMELPGLTMELLDVERETAQFDLSFDMTEIDGRLTGTVEYRTDLFEASAIRRMIGHFRTLLEAIAEEPKQRISELPLLTEPEHHQLLAEWNDTHSEYPADKTVVDMFEEQAKKSPENIAVVFEDIRLTYRELNERSNQIAHFITDEYQIRPDDRVGLLLERSEWIIIGIMGILKAGGAYVPVDPDYPEKRIEYMVNDSGCKAVFSEHKIIQSMNLNAEMTDIHNILHENSSNPVRSASPHNLAYAIYTSGSTGVPKGVLIEHHSVVNMVCGLKQVLYNRLFPSGVNIKEAMTSPFVFDVSVQQIFSSLIQGNTLYIIPDGILLNHRLFTELLNKNSVNLIDLTPAFLSSLIESGAELPETVQHINLGAEQLSYIMLRKFYEKYPYMTIANVYGPTESCVNTTLFHINSEFRSHSFTVPIGRPMPNIKVFILDKNLNAVPISVPGEICIAGAGLARGYLNQDDLTKEKFVPNPFKPDERLYRTGDLGRRLQDGNIEFLGRNDDQVKVRGYRIELGEIRNRLLCHKSVKDAAVIAKDFRGNEENELSAYVTAEGKLNISELRNHLKALLPDYMIPSYFIQLDEIPLLPSGKTDRKALPDPEGLRPDLESGYVMPRTQAERRIVEVWQEALGLEKVGVNDNFFDLGGHSLLIVRVQNMLREKFGINIAVVNLFRYPTIAALAGYLAQEDDRGEEAIQKVRDRAEKQKAATTAGAVAIIAMSGRFPGAGNIDDFWQNLCEGRECVSFFTDEDIAASGTDSSLSSHPNYVKAGGVLNDIEMFDASFFDFSPREAEMTDPQHLLFLEHAWEILETAGYNPGNYEGRIGVCAGAGINSYLFFNIGTNPELVSSSDVYQITITNDKDFIPTRVSYKLDLRGPSVNINTACSSSLVAVHYACQSLLSYQSDMALAGGVTIHVPQTRGYLYQEGGILSPDGRCRAFDADARGTVSGNGVGIVLLKRLEDAIEDGDTVYAVIRGSAVNNDGSSKVSYTAPSVEGQTEVIAEAQSLAGIDPETITYVEAHGTGTRLGDPIEIEALKRAFGTSKKGFCAIGSVKTNVGHLDTAAGVASLIKAALSLKYRKIPPSLHFKKPNPEIDFANSPFYVNTALSDWNTGEMPRRAGVSSFGIGGTNAHLVLEEAPPRENSGESGAWQMIALSAKTESALDAMSANLAKHLEQNPKINLADVAYTLLEGRKVFSHRKFMVARGARDEVVEVLRETDPRRVFTGLRDPGERPVAFMFSGQGAQYVNMGLELYQTEPVFREEVDRCAEILEPLMGLDLRNAIYPSGPSIVSGHLPVSGDGKQRTTDNTGRIHKFGDSPLEGGVFRRHDRLSEYEQHPPGPPQGGNIRWFPQAVDTPDNTQHTIDINQTAIAQPALFVIEYSLAKLWMSWGIRPQAMIGHSIGEYAAACLAGVFSLEDALSLVATRGRMMGEMPGGTMFAMPLPEKEVLALLETPLAPLNGKISLAAVNSPGFCVLSGPSDAMEELKNQLDRKNIICRPLHTSHAFHSDMMEPVTEAFAEKISRVTLKPPQIPFISDVTGTWITQEQSTDPDYWIRHLRQTVRFADGLGRLLEEPDRILLEVGPGRTLSTFATGRPDRKPGQTVLTSMRHPKDSHSDAEFILTTLGRLWLAGVRPDWVGFYAHEKRQRVHLPTYPFERKRYWIEPGNRSQQVMEKLEHRKLSTKRPDIADWFYVPLWKQSPQQISKVRLLDSGPWLIFEDECGLGSQISKYLKKEGECVITVRTGSGFHKRNYGEYTLNPQNDKDYHTLVRELSDSGKTPKNIVHIWSVTGKDREESDFEQIQDTGMRSLIFLVQALGKQNVTDKIRLTVVSDGIHQVTGDESLCPEKATLLGPAKIIPLEYSNIRCCSVDVVVPDNWRNEILKDLALAEAVGKFSEPVVAYRGSQRWVQIFEPIRLEKPSGEISSLLREEGVYLISGGLGGMGLVLAENLAKKLKAKLLLVGRSEFPPREHWEAWLANHEEQNIISRKIKKLQDMEASGGEILIFSADVSDQKKMRDIISEAQEQFGPINGVIHTAAVADYEGVISRRTKEMTERILAPKVKGTLVIEELLENTDPDFFMLFSSLGNVLYKTKFGEVGYNAANEFLDSFARYKAYKSRTLVVSVNWDDWKEVGMSLEALLKEDGMNIASMNSLENALLSEEGIEVFHRVLESGNHRVAISTRDLYIQFKEQEKLITAFLADSLDVKAPSKYHPRPELSNPYIKPSNKTEQTITEQWQNLLGIDEIGIRDNFFELGGNSLVAVQLISWLNETFRTELTLDTIFNATTVAELADIAGISDPLEDDSETIARKLELVEGLSDEKIKELLME